MKFTIRQVADILKAEVRGDDSLQIDRLAKIETATAGSISFLSNSKYEPFIYSTQASAVITNKDFEPKRIINTTLLLVDDAYISFTILLEKYAEFLQFSKIGIENPSFLGETQASERGIIEGHSLILAMIVTLGKM